MGAVERRKFIQLTGLGSIPLFFGACSIPEIEEVYDVAVDSNRLRGHVLREQLGKPVAATFENELLVIGGGVAGVAAYVKAQQEGKDVALLETNSYLGGSAGGGNFKSARFAKGAHYDLIYPSYYGKEALDLLQKAHVIEQNEFTSEYHFVDAQYLIDPKKESTCIRFGKRVHEPLSDFDELPIFEKLLQPYLGKMPMPTRLIPQELHALNNLDFHTWLMEQHAFSDELIRAVDYQMVDDWGGTSKEVSAIAGIHYYMCRDYSQSPELLSPPEGNLYFVEKLLGLSGYQNIHLNTLAAHIQETENGFEVKAYNFEKDQVELFKVKQIVYAGQKHSLQYVFPKVHRPELMANASAWVSINFVYPRPKEKVKNVFWQNDFIGENKNFMGFSDSRAQFDYIEKYDVLTAYYCFAPNEREKLIDFEKDPSEIIEQTIVYLKESLGENYPKKLKYVNVNILGHAMPLPKPGYLLNDWNQNRPIQNFTYAGVDTGNLPLFFEALDSGIQAVKALV